MGAESIHLIVADPPYFLDGLDDRWRNGRTSAKRATGGIGGLPVDMKFDPRQGRAFQDFIASAGKEFIRVLKPGAFTLTFANLASFTARPSRWRTAGSKFAIFSLGASLVWRSPKRFP